MPFVTETQLAKIRSQYGGAQNKLAKAKAKAEEKAGEIKDLAEMVGAAGLMGYVRGMMEKDGKQFVVPGTSIDLGLVAGVGLIGMGMADVLGKYDNDALMAGGGIMAHYFGQLGRNYGREGSFSLVAGDNILMGGGDPLTSLLAGGI